MEPDGKVSEDYREVSELLEAAAWIYAKSMPQWPHEYTLRKTWEEDDQYARVFRYIHEHGYDRKFYRKTFRSLIVGDYYYWPMTDDINKSLLMNRSNNPEFR